MLRSFDVRPPAPSRPAKPVPPAQPDPLPMARVIRKKKKSHGLLTLVIVGLVLILGATVAGLYLFGGWGAASSGVVVSIDAPGSITSGDQVTYRVKITNRDASLAVADLTLEYPAGFTIASATPAPANPAGQSLFHLAPLPAGQSTEVVVEGQLLGAVGSAAELRARLDYEPENFHSNFHADATASTNIAASRVRLAVDSPRSLVSPGQLLLGISLQNVADMPLNNLEVVIETPAGISVTSSTPPLASGTSGEQRLDIRTLDSGGTWASQLQADVVGDVGTSASIAVAVYQRLGQQRVIIERSLLELSVVQPSASLELVVNQSTNAAASAVWGGQVPIQLSLSSSSTIPLENLTLRLRVAGSAVDWNRLSDLGGGRRDGDAIVWDSNSSSIGSTLQRLDQGAQGSVSFSLPIASGANENIVQLVATLTSAAFGDDWRASSDPVTITVQ